MSGILFDHIAIGVPHIADATPFLVGELGGVPAGGSTAPQFRFYQWRFAGGGCIEVLEPLGPPDGFLFRFLAARGPGVHHVTFKVPDLAALCEGAERLGFSIVGRDESDPGWKEAFLHPKQAQGIVVQLAETGERPAGEPQREDPKPAGPPPARPAVEVVGLRLLVHDRERALRQWQQLLGGAATEHDGALHLRWPGSPMRIAIEVAPQRPEGPSAIELRSLRPRALPQRAHPVLGTRFAWVAD